MLSKFQASNKRVYSKIQGRLTNNQTQQLWLQKLIIILKESDYFLSSLYQYIQERMSKNMNGGPKSWKSSQEGHKTTNSMIIQNYCRYPAVNIPAVVVTHKNGRENHQKGFKIQRHYSEEDFKKHFTNYQTFIVQPPIKVEEEYFPQANSPVSKGSKQVFSRQKSGKLIQKQTNKEKSVFQNFNSRINGLKQTSSTQSAQNLAISRPTPSFVRSKFNKNSHPYQYFHQRLSTPRNNIRRENFKIISKLGEGKFGKVFLVKQIYTGFILAMKIVQKKKIMKQNLLEQFIRQLRIQSFLDHPNIISLYGLFADDTHFYTLMELGCDGQLYSLIANNKILTEQATSFIVKNLLQAINYVHTNKVLHRDIKPENIVLIMGNVKICDFGWAVNKLHPGDLRNTFCGTPLYLSPEILQGNRYDEKVDLWAIGILAFELYLGCTPFDIADQNDLFKIATDSIRFPADKEVSNEFKDFIIAMLTKNPNQRLTSKKLLEMDFITKYKDFQTCQQLCK